MSVELRQLRCLVAIAEAGSFTDAAIDLGISQAAASRTLASLETALGVRLLRRTTREVTLTAAGIRVLAHARRALARSAWTVATGRARVRRDRRAGGGVAVQVDVGPARGPGFLGADPGQQAQHDVGVHEFSRSADILQPGPGSS